MDQSILHHHLHQWHTTAGASQYKYKNGKFYPVNCELKLCMQFQLELTSYINGKTHLLDLLFAVQTELPVVGFGGAGLNVVVDDCSEVGDDVDVTEVVALTNEAVVVVAFSDATVVVAFSVANAVVAFSAETVVELSPETVVELFIGVAVEEVFEVVIFNVVMVVVVSFAATVAVVVSLERIVVF